MYSSYPNWVYSMFAFIGVVMVSIPFPWHLEAWNTGTCLYMAWTGLTCFVLFINSIVWNGNALNPAPVWCDITSRILFGCSIAIPAASLCINRRLYYISRVRSVTHSKAEKRRAIMVDLAIGLGIPILEMILLYIPQGHRFNIFEDIGCYPYAYNTWVSITIMSFPPIIIGLISAVYCSLSIKAFNESRIQSKEILSSNSNLGASRYFRLMALAGIDIICTTPLASYALYLNIKAGVNPWTSWEDVHWGFSAVHQYPALTWRSDPVLRTELELARWAPVFCAFVFFAFFGFADEAKKNYRSALGSVAKHVGFTGTGLGAFSFNDSKSDSIGTTGSLPVYVHSAVLRKKDSIGSLSNISVALSGDALSSEKYPDSKRVLPVLAYDSIMLPDLGGVLADHDSRSCSPTPSSGSSSSSSNSPIDLPEPAHTRPISMLSLRRHSYFESIDPDTAFVAPQHPIDTPSSVTRGSIDIV